MKENNAKQQAPFIVGARFGAVADCFESIVIVLAHDLSVQLWNLAADEATGIAASSAIGRNIQALSFGWCDQLVVCVQDAIRGSKPIRGHEIAYRMEDTHATVGVSVSPLEINPGQPMGYLILARDISEQKQYSKMMVHNSRLLSIGELAAGIAHEINTPTQYAENNLQYISIVLDDILDATLFATSDDDSVNLESYRAMLSGLDVASVAQELREALSDARAGLREISRIVDGVRRFSHPGTDGAPAPADVNEAIRSTVQLCTPRWKSKAPVSLALDESIPPVHCHIANIRQVLVNLISNAADAYGTRGQDGQPKGIVISSWRDGDNAVIEVKDDAGGISDEIVGRIFDPFFTTKPVGQGTGQGLAISHSIITDEHGGSIEVKSERGLGSVFVVRLPIQGRAVEPA